MSFLINEIADYLVTQGVGTAVGTDIFVDALPTGESFADNVVAIFQYSATPLLDGTTDQNFSFQFQVRDVSRDDAYGKALKIHSLLSGEGIDFPNRRAVFRKSALPSFVAPDASNRFQCVLSLRAVATVDTI